MYMILAYRMPTIVSYPESSSEQHWPASSSKRGQMKEIHGVLAVGVSEAARQLGISTRTMTNLVRNKEIVSRKIGRRRVIPVTALQQFLRRDH